MTGRLDRRARLALMLLLPAALLALIVVQFGNGFATVFASPDSGWLLKTGDYILHTGKIPQHDLYSWTCPQRHWVVYQWLFELICALFLQQGMLWLAGLATYASSGFILLFLLPRAWFARGVPVSTTLAMLLLSFNSVWFFLRPHLVSFLLISLFLYILERYRSGKSRSIVFALPPLMVLWANLHSFWFIGLAAILSYAIPAKEQGKTLWLILLLSAFCVLINPYGLELISYNWSFVSDADRGIAELHSPFLIPELECWTFLLYLGISCCLLLRNTRKVPREGLLFAALAAAGALYAARFMPVAILASWPFVGLALEKKEKAPGSIRKIVLNSPPAVIVHLAFSLALPVFLWAAGVQSQPAAARLFSQGQYEGISFLIKHNVSGERLYNDERLGSRLLFFNVCRVFIDNRFDMYGKEFCDRWLVVHYADPGWQDYLQSFAVTAIAIGDQEDLYKPLMAEPDWLLAYDDGRVSYWLLDTLEHRRQILNWSLLPATIGRAGLGPEQAEATAKNMKLKAALLHARGTAELKANKAEQALKSFRLLVFMLPENAEARHLLIHTLALCGKATELQGALRDARPFFWRFDGEAAAPRGRQQVYSSEQEKRIADWVRDSSKQLLKKYAGGP